MRVQLALPLFLSMAIAGTMPLLLPLPTRAQPADCASASVPPADALPLALNLGDLPGVPPNLGGQAYVNLPMSAGGMTCTDQRPPPRDILRGEPGDVLHGTGGNLLSGPSP
jgi:hypothetical protein